MADFGNALEPDKRCPDSQPVDAQVALEVLDEVGGNDRLTRRVADFLLTIATPSGGVPFVLAIGAAVSAGAVVGG
jgi:hypothetical protein